MWRKLRFWARFLQVFAKRYGWLLIIGLALGGIFFWAYPRLSLLMPRFRDTKTIGIVGRFNEENLPQAVLGKVSLGLTQIDEDGKASPGLAKDWTSTENGKVWTFELDDRLTWSNGEPIKSNEIQFNFKDVEITPVGDQKLEFKLQDPFSPLPSVVTAPVLKSDLTGIGPYKFARFKRIGNFFESANLAPISKESLLPNLRFVFYGTEEAAKTAFKLGEVDKLIDLLNVDEFKDWPNIEITTEEKLFRYVGLFFNLNNPNFKEKSIRQSLAYAIEDKSQGQQRVLSPIMEHSWAFNEHVKPYEYDLDRAKALFGDSSDEEEVEPIQLATVPSLLPVAENIAAGWNEFGMPTEVRVVNSVPEDFDVLLVTQEVPKDPDQYVLWHSTQPTNLTGYQSPKIDKLLEDGRKELDPEKRLEIYLDFQRFIVEEVPVIFLFRPVTYTIERS